MTKKPKQLRCGKLALKANHKFRFKDPTQIFKVIAKGGVLVSPLVRVQSIGSVQILVTPRIYRIQCGTLAFYCSLLYVCIKKYDSTS